jgi:ADP-heptose:LPS heptosyltransferase
MGPARARPRSRAILGVAASPSTPPAAILAIRPGGLGDTLFAFPALRALREAFPRARIAALGNPGFLVLARASGFVDEVASADAGWFGSLLSEESPIAPEARAFLGAFDLVLSWGFDEPLFVRRAKESGAREVLAFPFLPPRGSRRPVSAYLLESLREIGIRGGDAVPRVTVPAEVGAAARRELGDARPILAVHPGSGSPRKNWPAERFAEVATRFVETTGGKVLLVSGYADELPRRSFLRAFGHPHRLLEARDRPLLEVAALLRASTAYVGNDSGVTHLSAALGVPFVAVIGREGAAIFRPAGGSVGGLRRQPLPGIGANAVWRAVRTALLRRRRQSGDGRQVESGS